MWEKGVIFFSQALLLNYFLQSLPRHGIDRSAFNIVTKHN